MENTKEQLTVFGTIEPNYPAYVVLSKSQNFYSPIEEDILDNIIVDDAIVTITRNDGVTHKLTLINQEIIDSIADELQIPNIESPFHSIYIDINSNFKDFAQNSYSYQLDINWNHALVTAKTTIPAPTIINSVWCQCKETVGEEYKCYIWASIKDPDTLGNNLYATFKRLKSSDKIDPKFVRCARSTRSDILFNGTNFTTYFSRSGKVAGNDGGLLPFYGSGIKEDKPIEKDVVLFKLSQIDNATYKFWRSLKMQDEMGENPFSEPINLVSNIKGGLGIWAGYGATYYKIPIVKDTVIYLNFFPNMFEIF